MDKYKTESRRFYDGTIFTVLTPEPTYSRRAVVHAPQIHVAIWTACGRGRDRNSVRYGNDEPVRRRVWVRARYAQRRLDDGLGSVRTPCRSIRSIGSR